MYHGGTGRGRMLHCCGWLVFLGTGKSLPQSSPQIFRLLSLTPRVHPRKGMSLPPPLSGQPTLENNLISDS